MRATPQCGTTRDLPLHDRGALGALLKHLEPRLTAVALGLVRDPVAAEDVVQAAFEKAIRKGHAFRGDSRVSTWLHRIVANEALMWLRTRRRHDARTRGLEELEDEDLADTAPGAMDRLERRQSMHRVRRAVLALPTDERDVLLACALAGRSYAQVGRETGVHPSALKSRAFRARRRLEEALGSRVGNGA